MTGPQTVRDYEALRRVLVARRLQLAFTPEQLAAVAGVPIGKVRRIEFGFGALDDKSLPGILNALQLEMTIAPRAQTRAA